MKKHIRFLTHAAVIGAMYVVLTWTQNLLFPDSASMAVQFRAAEALCVLAFLTPAAIPGLAVGCFLFNITSSGALPLDPVVGTLATVLSTWLMYLTRRVRLWGQPVLGLLMPALCNALLVGWELTVFVGGGFWFNAGCVALGELGVLFTLGIILLAAMEKRGLGRRLFGSND